MRPTSTRARGRQVAAAAVLVAALGVGLGGCGAELPLPFEAPEGAIPPDSSYQVVDVWSHGQDGADLLGIRDILITQGSGSQLFMVFNQGGTGIAPRGRVNAYPFTRPTPILGIDFPGVFSPVAIASDGDFVFVLDQGDTCLGRAEPTAGTCNVPGWTNRVTNYDAYWRVRRYGLLGGLSDANDSVSTFTDTTMAYVQGIAADDQGRVYVSGTAIIYIVDPDDSRFRTRTFQFRVYRYVPVPRFLGDAPPDRNMPDSFWRRDSTWVAEEGSGLGTLIDPRGLFWSGVGGPALYATDFGKSVVQKLSVHLPSAGFYALDGAESGQPFAGPTDVAVDLAGFVYGLDPGSRRVLRFDPRGTYVQVVNFRGQEGDTLTDPVTAAVNDSMVYVGDGAGKVIRYRRRF